MKTKGGEKIRTRPNDAPPSAIEDEGTTNRALSVVVAMVLTALLLVGLRPEQPLWWGLAALTLSFWMFAVHPILIEAVSVALAWLTQGLEHLQDLLIGFRRATIGWVDRRFWSRFRRAE